MSTRSAIAGGGANSMSSEDIVDKASVTLAGLSWRERCATGKWLSNANVWQHNWQADGGG